MQDKSRTRLRILHKWTGRTLYEKVFSAKHRSILLSCRPRLLYSHKNLEMETVIAQPSCCHNIGIITLVLRHRKAEPTNHYTI